MATRYQLYANTPDTGRVLNSIKRILDDGTISCIPMSDGNRDYQEYLAWVAAGNTPEAAE